MILLEWGDLCGREPRSFGAVPKPIFFVNNSLRAHALGAPYRSPHIAQYHQLSDDCGSATGRVGWGKPVHSTPANRRDGLMTSGTRLARCFRSATLNVVDTYYGSVAPRARNRGGSTVSPSSIPAATPMAKVSGADPPFTASSSLSLTGRISLSCCISHKAIHEKCSADRWRSAKPDHAVKKPR
jgi:hypothetical protein